MSSARVVAESVNRIGVYRCTLLDFALVCEHRLYPIVQLKDLDSASLEIY